MFTPSAMYARAIIMAIIKNNPVEIAVPFLAGTFQWSINEAQYVYSSYLPVINNLHRGNC